MHEIGLCGAIVDAALARAGGRRVTAVRVRAGSQHRIVPESMQLAWRMVADGTVAEDAVVALDVVPVQLLCRVCGAVTETEDAFASCGACGSDDVDASGGDELTLVSLTVDARG